MVGSVWKWVGPVLGGQSEQTGRFERGLKETGLHSNRPLQTK